MRFDPHTCTAADVIAAYIADNGALPLHAELRRVALIDSVAHADFARQGRSDAARIANDRWADLMADAELLEEGLQPETFTGRLNAFSFAAAHYGISRVGQYAILERAPLIAA